MLVLINFKTLRRSSIIEWHGNWEDVLALVNFYSAWDKRDILIRNERVHYHFFQFQNSTRPRRRFTLIELTIVGLFGVRDVLLLLLRSYRTACTVFCIRSTPGSCPHGINRNCWLTLPEEGCNCIDLPDIAWIIGGKWWKVSGKCIIKTAMVTFWIWSVEICKIDESLCFYY